MTILKTKILSVRFQSTNSRKCKPDQTRNWIFLTSWTRTQRILSQPSSSKKYSSHSINFSYGTLNYQCVSRIDETDHKVFHPKGKNQGRRWNLYSQIAIDNDTLHCAKESYDLTEICDDNKGFWGSTKPCTLQDTNEVVELDYEGYV